MKRYRTRLFKRMMDVHLRSKSPSYFLRVASSKVPSMKSSSCKIAVLFTLIDDRYAIMAL
jgi:hypothetical protein